MVSNSMAAVTLAAFLIVGCTPAPTDPSDAAPDTLRVLAYNIHHGEGMDERIDLVRIAALIDSIDPDIVTLQEVDSVVVRTGGVDQAKELGALTDMEPVFGRFMAYQGGAYGMAVLSKWPVTSSENIRLPDGLEPRTAVSATVRLPSGREVRVVGIHFYATEDERLAQATVLDTHLDASSMPTILAGDYNSTPNSPVMDFLARDWTILNKGEDRLTFSSFAPEREIDFLLVQPVEVFEVISHDVLDEPVISDHRPVVATLVLSGSTSEEGR